MLSAERVKTITIHTRKQVIALFQELKQKTNNAYEQQSEHAFRQLLIIIKTLYFLSPVKEYLREINSVGTITVVSYLQKLLIKLKMIKINEKEKIRQWLVAVILKFQANALSNKIDKIQEYRQEIKSYSFVTQSNVIQFYHQSLQCSVGSNHPNFVGVIIDFLRVHLVSMEDWSILELENKLQKWQKIIGLLIVGCRIVNDIKRQEIGVSICYFLCSSKQIFYSIAIKANIIPFLIISLTKNDISQTYGKRIIEFLKRLLLNLDQKDLATNCFHYEEIETVVVKFSRSFDTQQNKLIIKDLMNLLDKKFIEIDYESKFRNASSEYDKWLLKIQNHQLTAHYLHAIDICNQSDKTEKLIDKYYKPLFLKILDSQTEISMVKEVLSIMSDSFRKGNQEMSVGVSLINKIDKLLTGDFYKDELLSNKKRMLISLVQIIKKLLECREHNPQIVKLIHDHKILNKLGVFSDCTSFFYQRQLYEFQKMLKSNSKSFDEIQIKIVKTLERSLIQKSKETNKKTGFEDLQEIKFLYTVLTKPQDNTSLAKLNNQTIMAIGKKMNPKISSTENRLIGLGNSEYEQVQKNRKEINLYGVKIMVELLKKGLPADKTLNSILHKKIMEINASVQQKEEIHIQCAEYEQLYEKLYLNQTKAIESQPQNKLANLNEPKLVKVQTNKSKQTLSELQIRKINKRSDLQTISKLIFQQQFKGAEILKYLRCLHELSKKPFMRKRVYQSEGKKILEILSKLKENSFGLNAQSSNQSYQIIDGVMIQVTKFHFLQLFADVPLSIETIGLFQTYLKFVQQYFQVGFSSKRIISLQAIFELFQAGRILLDASYFEFDHYFSIIFNAVKVNHNLVGKIIDLLLKGVSKQQQNTIFWLQHKQNILNNLNKQSKNNLVYAFLSDYLLDCTCTLYEDNGLADVVQTLLKVLESSTIQVQSGNQNEQCLALKLHKISLISQILLNIKYNPQIKFNKNLIYLEEQILRKTIHNLVLTKSKYLQNFKLLLLETTITNLLISLVKTYQMNYKTQIIKHGAQLLVYFKQFLQFKNSQLKTIAWQFLRVILLKQYSAVNSSQYLQMGMQRYNQFGELAKQHFDACLRIVENQGSKNEQLIKRQYLQYFQNDETIADIIPKAQQQMIKLNQEQNLNVNSYEGGRQQNEQEWGNQKLIYHLKKLFDSQRLYGIKQLSLKLIKIEDNNYTNLLLEIFINSDQFYKQDSNQQIQISLEDVQSHIIQAVSENNCLVAELFYRVLAKNKTGSKLCLRVKNIGLRGIAILTQKFFCSSDLQNIIDYGQMLWATVDTTDEIRHLYNCKIYEVINQKIKSEFNNRRFIQVISRLIRSTCKLRLFQDHYDVGDQLCECLKIYNKDMNILEDVMEALCALTLDSDKNKKHIGQRSIIQTILNLIQKQDENILRLSYLLLFNLLEDNAYLIKTYLQLNVMEFAIKQIQKELTFSEFHPTILIILLKLVCEMLVNADNCMRAINYSFVKISKQTNDRAIKHQNWQIVSECLVVMDKLISHLEISLNKIISKLQQEGVIQFLEEIQNISSISLQNVQLFLNLLSVLLKNRQFAKRCLGDNSINLLLILQRLLKKSQSNEIVFQKWSKCLFNTFQTTDYDCMRNVLESNILFAAANYIRSLTNLTDKTLEMNMKVIEELNKRDFSKNIIIKFGLGDYLIEHIKMKRIKSDDYFKCVTILTKMQIKHVFSAALSNRIFQVIIKKLYTEVNHQLVFKMIILIKRIKKHITISEQDGQHLLQFIIKYLTQSSYLSSYHYFELSKQIICLISYFVSFNPQIKSIFAHQHLADVLKNWLKVSKSLNYIQMPLLYKIYIFSLHNNEPLLLNLSQITQKKVQVCEQTLERGFKCYLYRFDKSSKNAMIRYDKLQKQIVAFKFPDGVIKNKYRIPVRFIFCLRQNYQNSNDICFIQSNFLKASNIFQREVVFNRCLTLIGFIQNSTQVREISVQFERDTDKADFVQSLQIMLHKNYQRQLEEQNAYYKENDN